MESMWHWVEQLRSLSMSVWIAVIVASLVIMIVLPYMTNLGKNLPPGPPSWPIIGSLMYMEGDLHLALLRHSKKYGPVVRIGLGQFMLILVSSRDAAEELLKKKDSEFHHRAARTIQRSAAKYIGMDAQDIAFSEYNAHLRLLRKFCTTELFTTSRIAASAKIRVRECNIMMNAIKEYSANGDLVPVRDLLHTMSINSICQMLFGKRYYGKGIPESEFAQVVKTVFDNAGKLNLADLIPMLRWFDLQGIEKSYKRSRPQTERLLGEIIEEHRRKARELGPLDYNDMDFVDVLLQPMGKEFLSEKAIVGTLYDMIIAGTDTTAQTTEWCMVEAVRYPEHTKRMQQEIESVVGAERQVEESDLPKLPFLQAFVKEAMRLHPTVPITLPRLNEEASTLGGFYIPPDSTVFVNIYALSHDEAYWEKPMEFIPERFLEKNMSLMGTDYELLPFGSGRRKCVGYQLGINSVSRSFAAMIHAYDWSPPTGIKPHDLDVSDVYTLVLRNKYPLKAFATPRAAARHY